MILTVAHTKGGVGKSTIAWNIAHALKRQGKEVTIIDLDFQQTLFFISKIDKISKTKVLQPKNAEELIKLFEETKGYVVVDLGGFDNDINRIALSWSDKILVPISASVTEIIGFKTFENILGEIDCKDINIVLNNIHPLTKNLEDVYKAIATQKSTTLLKTIIRSRKIYKDSMLAGRSVFYYKNTKAKKEISGLLHELL